MHKRNKKKPKIKSLNILSSLFLCFLIVVAVSFIPEAKAAQDFYQAKRLEQSHPETINLEPGKAITFWVRYKNAGIYRFRPEGPRRVYLKVKDDNGATQKFRHLFWLDAETATALKDKIVNPGEEAIFRFALQAPKEPGLYWLKFNLMAYDNWVSGGDIEISVRVLKKEIEEASDSNSGASTSTANNGGSDTAESPANQVIHKEVYKIEDLEIPEAKVRVGLYHTSSTVDIQANGAYGIYGKDGNLLVNQTQGEASQIEFDFQNKRYFLNVAGRRLISSDGYFKLMPKDENVIFTITNYSNPAYDGSSINYNQFRGTIEAEWIEENERFWVINELEMEKYLKGIGEAMDVSPYEYLKAMAIAERTYAMYQFLNPTKHAIRNFTVTASEADQIYQGYVREIGQPNVVRAVEETKGVVVTYQNQVALTPYFSQSDGRTRSYEEVWQKKDYPYLVAVEDPYMKGQKMLGHGVGMSARGALYMASKDNANFEDILYHYYQGIELKKVY